MVLPSSTPGLLLLCAAGTLATAAGIAAPQLAGPAACMTGIAALAGSVRIAPSALVAALPVLALLPGGGLLALGGFAGGAMAGSVGLACLVELVRSRPNSVQEDLAREAEHEQKRLRNSIERYPLLLDSCLELSSARELDSLAHSLCKRARLLLPEILELHVFLGTATRQRCCASSDRDGQPIPREPGPEELYIAAEARSLTDRRHGRLRVYVPLRADRRQAEGNASAEASRGVMVATLSEQALGTGVNLELLHALGRLGGMGLATVDLVTQARSLALHDDLTGLFGQHEFLRRLEEQVGHARRHQHALGVMMCDLDHLKRYNDRWGHAAGDQALNAVARSINACLPAGAIACRYGGEEFALLVPDLDPQALADFAERLRATIERAELDPSQPGRSLTTSIGYATVAAKEEGKAALARADAACYRAKANGRNRAEAAP